MATTELSKNGWADGAVLVLNPSGGQKFRSGEDFARDFRWPTSRIQAAPLVKAFRLLCRRVGQSEQRRRLRAAGQPGRWHPARGKVDRETLSRARSLPRR